MSKTKVMEVWVTKGFMDGESGVGRLTKDFGFKHIINGEECYKVKLVQEITEKKITISESEFNDVVRKSYQNTHFTDQFVSKLRKELFDK